MKGRLSVFAAAALAAASAPAAGQNADWQLDPMPLLQGEWEYWGPEDNASWGGYAKIRIEGQKVTMVDALHPGYFGSPWSKAPAGAVIMNIERWTQDSTTGDHQLIIRGTCFDYSNSNGRPGSCWHVITKFRAGNRNRQGKEVSWGFSIFERLRDGTTGAAGYSKAETPQAAPTPPRPASSAIQPPARDTMNTPTAPPAQQAVRDPAQAKKEAAEQEERERAEAYARQVAEYQRKLSENQRAVAAAAEARTQFEAASAETNRQNEATRLAAVEAQREYQEKQAQYERDRAAWEAETAKSRK